MFLGKGGLKICNKFTGEHPGCSPVNMLHIFRTPFPKNTSDGLFLNFIWFHYLMLFFIQKRRIKYKEVDMQSLREKITQYFFHVLNSCIFSYAIFIPIKSNISFYFHNIKGKHLKSVLCFEFLSAH